MSAPTTPTLTVSISGTTATATVDGDASVTNYVYYMKSTETSWTLGGSRSGDGTVTISSLVSGQLYFFEAVSKNTGNEYSLFSSLVSETALSASDITVTCYQNRNATTSGATSTVFTHDADNVIQKFKPVGSGRMMMIQIDIPAAVNAPIAAVGTEFTPVPLETTFDR